LTHFVNLDDVRVLQRCNGLGFSSKTSQSLVISQQRRGDHFHGDRSLQLQVPGLVHYPHAASTQLLQKLMSGHARQWRLFLPLRNEILIDRRERPEEHVPVVMGEALEVHFMPWTVPPA